MKQPWQKTYFLEHGEFASTFEDLGFVDSYDSAYSYSLITESNHQERISILAIPNNSEDRLPSYISALFMVPAQNGATTVISELCKSIAPNATPLVMPKLSSNKNEINCPNDFKQADY